MIVVNPVGRTPEDQSNIMREGCHCVCNADLNNHFSPYAQAILPFVTDCMCACAGPAVPGNDAANNQTAWNAAHPGG